MRNVPVHESQLPPVLFIEHLAALLGTSIRTVEKRSKGRAWPFTELPKVDRKRRWSRDQVVAIISAGSVRGRR